MPRGPVVFTLPPGTTPQSPGDVIQSAVWNAAMDDVAQTFNTVQPIEYGGTGSSSAVAALDSLSIKSGDIASATTTNIWTSSGEWIAITGTTTISSFGSATAAGNYRSLLSVSGFTITYSPTSLITPGAVDLVLNAGDVIGVRSEGGSNARVVSVTRAVTRIAPLPTSSTGLGNFAIFSGPSSGQWQLPSTGTYAYWGTRYNSSGAFQAYVSGVDVGGTIVGIGVTGDIWRGTYWRIS